jgi:DNA repair exonuclease SbcCD ATPase subunit
MEVSAQTSDLEQINSWKEEVNGARESLRSMRSDLEQIARHKTDDEALVQIEHFQNRFICQQERADEMHHDLKQSAKKISNNGQPPIFHDDRPVDDFDVLQDRMNTFSKLYNELQDDFRRFRSY